MGMEKSASGWAIRQIELVFPEGIGGKKMFTEVIMMTKFHSKEDPVIKT